MNRFLSDEIGDLRDWFQGREHAETRISRRAVRSLIDQLTYLRARACELEENNSRLLWNHETGKADDGMRVFVSRAWDGAVPFDEATRAAFARALREWPGSLNADGHGVDEIRAWLRDWLRHWTIEFGHKPDPKLADAMFHISPDFVEACLNGQHDKPADFVAKPPNVITFPGPRRSADGGSPSNGSAA